MRLKSRLGIRLPPRPHLSAAPCRFRLAAAAAAAAVALSGCIGIETRVTIDNDGSGQLDLVYTVSRVASELRDDGGSALPFPVNETDFREAVANVDGLRLRQYRQQRTSDHILITAGIDFDTVDAIAELGSFAEMAASLTQEGDRTTYRQALGSGQGQQGPLSDEAQQMVDALFGEYQVVFTVAAPADIVASSGGVLSDDRRSLVFSMALTEWVADDASRVLEASW